jgi:hypothetical protein
MPEHDAGPADDDEAGEMSPEDAARWQTARTLADLGELTAQWLEGKIASVPRVIPGYGPDEETRELIPILAAANRAGFVTDQTQPAEQPAIGYDGATYQQRAAVSGFASDQVLTRLRDAISGGSLYLTTRKAGHLQVSYRHAIPVTCRDGEPCTWFGPVVNHAQLRDEWTGYGMCHPDAVIAVCDAWQVAIVDPEWGRNGVLWPALQRFAAD